jgi:hypothetical protein
LRRYNKYSPAHASLTASVVIPYAGNWSVSVTQGTYNVQHFLGSPHLITVAAAATDPASCEADFPVVVQAGSAFTALVFTFDEFENPTSHPEDYFNFTYVGEDASMTVSRDGASPDVKFSELMTSAGSYKLNVTFADTGDEIAGSPLNFDVLAGTADAASSTHNIVFDEFESRKSADVELELRVDPFDQFNNTLPTATGYAVSINGGKPISLVAPLFSYTYMVPQRYEPRAKRAQRQALQCASEQAPTRAPRGASERAQRRAAQATRRESRSEHNFAQLH